MVSDTVLYRVGPRDGLLSGVGAALLHVDDLVPDRHTLASPVAAEMLHEDGWRSTEADAWSEAAARLDTLAAECRVKARALAPDTAPGTSASPCSSLTTPDVEARGAVSLPGEGLLRHPERIEERGEYKGMFWHVYREHGQWHYCVEDIIDDAELVCGTSGTRQGAVHKMCTAMGWTAPAGEGVSDA